MLLGNLTKQSIMPFLYTLGNWVTVYIEDYTKPILDFVNWLSLK